jgi:hypothetical protein
MPPPDRSGGRRRRSAAQGTDAASKTGTGHGQFDHWLRAFRRHRFAWLLGLLLLTLAGAPLLKAVTGIDLMEFLLAVTLLAAIAASSDRGWTRWLIGLGLAFIVVRSTQAIMGAQALVSVSQALWMAAMLVAMAVMVRFAFKTGPVDSERVSAALDAYLVLGLLFGVCFWLVDQLAPGSIRMASEGAFTLNRAVYFSFVTIATLGYGDIVPASEVAGGVAVVEAVIGQFYLVVIVARLVSLYARQADTGP